MRGALGGSVARVAITEGVGEWYAGGVDANVVDGPAIDCDGADALRREVDALTQARFDAVDDAREIPAKAAVELSRVIGEAVDKLDRGPGIVPAKERDPAALRAEVYGDGRCAGVWLQRACRRPLNQL